MFGSELLEIIGPAVAAGLMIALTHAPLGIEVLRRGIIFIDLAVAQIAGLGLVVGNMVIHDPSPWLIQFIALGCAVAAGLFFRKVETAMPERQEAIIGCGVRSNMGFYLLFALAITSSVQLVGVYVVFASLILPALAAVHVKRPYLIAWLCGVAAVLSGIAFAVAFDMPAGPVIILSYAAAVLIIRGIRIANKKTT